MAKQASARMKIFRKSASRTLPENKIEGVLSSHLFSNDYNTVASIQYSAMLSYQHSYHAGNHADVLKYILLGDIVTAMQKKASPLFLFDAFASRGIYALTSPEALKNREFDSGIGRLWSLRENSLPAGVARWFGLIEHENPVSGFERFPGSTALLASMLRDSDRLAACDLHPKEFEGLRNSFSSGRKLALHNRDAFEALGALLPPKEKRGMVFLDPSYENKDEYSKIAQTIADVYPRIRAGVYVIWYPLLEAARHNDLCNGLKRSGIRNILRVELDCGDSFPEMQMFGSGLLIINPPWHAMAAMQASLNWVAEHLISEQVVSMNQGCEKWADGPAKSHFGWLVPE